MQSSKFISYNGFQYPIINYPVKKFEHFKTRFIVDYHIMHYFFLGVQFLLFLCFSKAGDNNSRFFWSCFSMACLFKLFLYPKLLSQMSQVNGFIFSLMNCFDVLIQTRFLCKARVTCRAIIFYTLMNSSNMKFQTLPS